MPGTRIGSASSTASWPRTGCSKRRFAYAEKLASRAPLAQRFAKEVVHRTHGLPMDEALRLESMSFRNLAHTEDFAEGNAAFRERRRARFKAR